MSNGTGRAFGLAALIALAAGLLPLWLAARAVPEIDVHAVPWLTHSGRLLERYPIGQSFRCEETGLRRIEVALVALRSPAHGSVLLRLFAEGPEGELLREVEVEPGLLPSPGAFVAFDFEPIEDSAGRVFHFELRPAGGVKPAESSAWVRYRGHVGHDGAWGDRRYEGPTFDGRVRAALPPGVEPKPGDQSKPDDVPHPALRALSFAALLVAPRLGEARLELFEEGSDGPPIRTVTLAPEDEVQGGFVFFAFEPIADSRWKRYRYHLTLPEGSVLVGDASGPTLKTWHGLEGGDPDLLGASAGGLRRSDRDLVFRAWTWPHPLRALERLGERAGWRLPLGSLLWLIASATMLRACLPHRGARKLEGADSLATGGELGTRLPPASRPETP